MKKMDLIKALEGVNDDAEILFGSQIDGILGFTADEIYLMNEREVGWISAPETRCDVLITSYAIDRGGSNGRLIYFEDESDYSHDDDWFIYDETGLY